MIDTQTGLPEARELEQVFFYTSDQIQLAQCFVSGFVLLTDATFNTNRLKMPLSIQVGITNTGMSIPIAFSFIRSESHEAFNFIFHSMQEMIWIDCPLPKLIIGDQAAGLIASMKDLMPKFPLQFCEWHAVNSIKKNITDSKGYTRDKREELAGFIWKYIQSWTLEQLESNRTALMNELHLAE